MYTTTEPKLRWCEVIASGPPLGIGTWAWGDRLFWGYGNGYAESDVKDAFETAIAAGVNFFDTAEIYGNGESERLLGKLVRESHQNVAIATKFFPYPWRWRRQDVTAALRKSLERLGVSQVELYQIHQPLPPVSIETWMDGLADAVEEGLTRAVGVSNYNAEQTRRAHAALARRNIPLASNQIKYSLLHRGPERDGTLDACRELGVCVIAYSPIGQGLLTGKYTPAHPPRGVRALRAGRGTLVRVQPLVKRMREMGAAHGDKTPAEVALNWLIYKGTMPIPGAKNTQQAKEDVGGVDWSLTEEEVGELDALSDKVSNG